MILILFFNQKSHLQIIEETASYLFGNSIAFNNVSGII